MAKSGVEPIRIHTAVFHRGPHLEEVYAWFMVLNYGENSFPGAANARFEFWGSGGTTPDGRPVEEWEREGYLVIGTGGGRFDEHPARHNGTTALTSSAQLIAEFLGISDRPELQQLLKYANRIDSQGGGNFMEVPNLLPPMHQQRGAEFAINWALAGISVQVKAQRKFFEATGEFAMRATWLAVPGATRRVAAIESDNGLIHKAARRAGCEVLVQKKPTTGHVQIFVDKRARPKVNLPAVAMALRQNELVRCGAIVNWADINGKEGLHHRWYLQSGAGWLFNGSDTATDIPATAQMFKDVCALVVQNIERR